MVKLVAEAPGGKARAGHLKPFAVSVLSLHGDIKRSGNDAVFTRYAQAALGPCLLAVGGDYDRVYKLDDLFLLPFRHIG